MSIETPMIPAGPSADESRPERAVLTATELRQLAEWAHSVRGEHMCMVVFPRRPGEALWYTPLPAVVAERMGPEYIVIPVETRNRVADRPAVRGMKIELRNKPTDEKGEEVDFFEKCWEAYGTYPDAMFWTESSVEKFLLPYYASVYSSSDAVSERIKEIDDLFDGKVPPRMASAMEGAKDGEVTVYAMVHLPKSEYVASPPIEPTETPGVPERPAVPERPRTPALGVLYSTPASSDAVPELKVAVLPLP
jgi:hypothetical protein